jgi:hypothetical protein
MVVERRMGRQDFGGGDCGSLGMRNASNRKSGTAVASPDAFEK